MVNFLADTKLIHIELSKYQSSNTGQQSNDFRRFRAFGAGRGLAFTNGTGSIQLVVLYVQDAIKITHLAAWGYTWVDARTLKSSVTTLILVGDSMTTTAPAGISPAKLITHYYIKIM